MNKVFEKIIENLEMQKDYYKTIRKNTYCRRTEMDDCDSCRADHYLEARLSAIDDAIEIVKQEAEQYEECYKDCGDCEAYNKEKHHCPKFCNVIKETVKEIEENHNGWIPCSERMPEDEQVVITCKYKSISILRYSTKTNHWYELNGNWWWSANMVTAWQPLPQPYQQKGDE